MNGHDKFTTMLSKKRVPPARAKFPPRGEAAHSAGTGGIKKPSDRVAGLNLVVMAVRSFHGSVPPKRVLKVSLHFHYAPRV